MIGVPFDNLKPSQQQLKRVDAFAIRKNGFLQRQVS